MKKVKGLLFLLILYQGLLLYGQVPGTPIIFKSKPAIVSTLNCSGTLTGSLLFGSGYSGTKEISYTGGNGGNYVISVSSTGVTGLTASGSGTLVSGSGSFNLSITGVPSGSGTASFTVAIGAQNCSFNASVGAMTLTAGQRRFIASVYDDDYLPYTMPTGPATTDVVNASGTTDPLADYQGILTTTGVTVQIPYTVTVSSVTLPAFSQVVNVPASLTEDGISRDVELSYPGSTYGTGSGTITATIKSLAGTLNVKKLDINAGIGNDNLGVLLAGFTISTNSSGGTGPVQLRGIAGIPDRRYGDGSGHDFMYLPVASVSGKIWLNNNLGAHYSNSNHSEFNPAQQATAYNDYRAFGSTFQWGRYSDGHELNNWTNTSANPVNGTTTILATTDTPNHSLQILTFAFPHDWRSDNNNNRWASGNNNPCPEGFRVPTEAEFNAEITANSITNMSTAHSSPLRFSETGLRDTSNSGNVGHYSDGRYWTSNISGVEARFRHITSSSTINTQTFRGYGLAVRCIQN